MCCMWWAEVEGEEEEEDAEVEEAEEGEGEEEEAVEDEEEVIGEDDEEGKTVHPKLAPTGVIMLTGPSEVFAARVCCLLHYRNCPFGRNAAATSACL